MNGVPNFRNASPSLRKEVGDSVPSTGFPRPVPGKSPDTPLGSRMVPFLVSNTDKAVKARGPVLRPNPFEQ